MSIEIYEYNPAPKNAMFPSIESSIKLIAVAPLERHLDVEIWCSEKNKEAIEAGVIRRFKYSVTAIKIWDKERCVEAVHPVSRSSTGRGSF